MLAAGCQQDIASIDGVFYDGDQRTVHCAVDLDTKGRISTASIDSALDRALDRGEVVELYAHKPGGSVTVDVIEHVLAGARDRGLAFVTYADFARGTEVRPGLALSFDDSSIEAWVETLPLLRDYGATVTFFISRYAGLGDDQRAQVKLLAADGHDIEPHTVNHLRGPDYVEQHGLAAYLADEVVPSIDILEADGYPASAFAYPFGARTSETDHAILEHVRVLRSVSFTFEGVVSPCPR